MGITEPMRDKKFEHSYEISLLKFGEGMSANLSFFADLIGFAETWCKKRYGKGNYYCFYKKATGFNELFVEVKKEL